MEHFCQERTASNIKQYDCFTETVRRQHPWNSLRDLRKGEFLAHRHHSGVNDETENGAPTGRRRPHDQG
jgi:hypothetical protein